jgi:hypothetical protein
VPHVPVVRGVLLGATSVMSQLAPDGAIEIIGLELDTAWPDDGTDTDRLDDGAEG